MCAATINGVPIVRLTHTLQTPYFDSVDELQQHVCIFDANVIFLVSSACLGHKCTRHIETQGNRSVYAHSTRFIEDLERCHQYRVWSSDDYASSAAENKGSHNSPLIYLGV